ncbi:MAG TPA: amidase [Candidatus Binataceae bacterium]
MRDRFGAFCAHVDVSILASGRGPLAGLSFAAKDNFDVEGLVCCAGNPDWLRTHQAARATAPAIRMLLNGGASLAGKTIMDEMAFSVSGENAHFGTPINPCAPERMPGGSSSGSAAAVAGGLVDFAIGSDTGGSVRVPASYCGLFGIRPTHGRISTAGLIPHVPSADTVGWFARDAATLARVGTVLLGAATAPAPPSRLLVVDDAFAVARGAVRAALNGALTVVERLFPSVEHITLSSAGLSRWVEVYRAIQNYSAWQSHREWIERVKPNFSDTIRERFAIAARTTHSDFEAASRERERIRGAIDVLVRDAAILCVPTTPNIAPPRNDLSIGNSYRDALFSLACTAGLAGLPQLSLPIAESDGCPLGLSLLAARNGDETLLALAPQIAGAST